MRLDWIVTDVTGKTWSKEQIQKLEARRVELVDIWNQVSLAALVHNDDPVDSNPADEFFSLDGEPDRPTVGDDRQVTDWWVPLNLFNLGDDGQEFAF